jgi:hypothetical protein
MSELTDRQLFEIGEQIKREMTTDDAERISATISAQIDNYGYSYTDDMLIVWSTEELIIM